MRVDMADLADKIDDLICVFDGTLTDATLDAIAMYLFGFFVFLLVLTTLSYYLYVKYKNRGRGAVDQASLEKEQQNKQELSMCVGITNNHHHQQRSPSVRKRLGSKSGAKMQNYVSNVTSKFISPVTPPLATGPDVESVKWVNEFMHWLYLDAVVVAEFLNIWIKSMNEFMKESVTEHGVGVELVKILTETPAPTLTNIFCECASNDDVSITCDCEATPIFQLKGFRQKDDRVEVSHYRLNVTRLRGRLSIFCITEKMQVEIKFAGWPELKIGMARVGSIKNNLDEQTLQNVILEIVGLAIRSTAVTLNLNPYSCPRLMRNRTNNCPNLPLHYDSLVCAQQRVSNSIPSKILVKVVNAMDLAVTAKDCVRGIYCVVEVDNPSQTNHTVNGIGNSPEWNEHFLLNIGPLTKEIMFEVYGCWDKTCRNVKLDQFLGLAIVGVKELGENVSHKQLLSLQSRPYQNDVVTGTLVLEFLFIHGSNSVVGRVETAKHLITTAKVYSAKSNATTGGYNYNNESTKETAIKELEWINKNDSTMIPGYNQQTFNGCSRLAVATTNNQPSYNNNKNEEVSRGEPNEQSNRDEGGDRGRKRKRDLFGTFRRRFKSHGRSKSVEKNSNIVDEDRNNRNSSRSASVDRVRDNSSHSQQSIIGPLPREGSARSSVSEMSGISGASSRTYLNDASTLILETVENGIIKHYLVPLSLAQKNKWKKKGTKLHVFNDHTFVAKHLSGGTVCEVCRKVLPRRLGKQGYECRDCLLKCHKQCHVRVENMCLQSTIQNLELSGSIKKNINRR